MKKRTTRHDFSKVASSCERCSSTTSLRTVEGPNDTELFLCEKCFGKATTADPLTYQCEACGHLFLVAKDDPEPTACPECGSARVECLEQ